MTPATTKPWHRFGLADFLALADDLWCHDCDTVGTLVPSAPHSKNNGIRPVCAYRPIMITQIGSS